MPKSKVKGVLISSTAEQVAGREKMTTYDIPTNHEIYNIGGLCPVSQLVGMPLLVYKIRLTTPHDSRPDSIHYQLSPPYYPNHTASKLMVDSDPDELELKPAEGWKDTAGNVIVVRKDRKPLYAVHVRVLLDFMDKVMYPGAAVLPDGHRTRSSTASPLDIIAHLTPGDFKDYYMAERYYWQSAGQDAANRAALPTPWTQD